MKHFTNSLIKTALTFALLLNFSCGESVEESQEAEVNNELLSESATENSFMPLVDGSTYQYLVTFNGEKKTSKLKVEKVENFEGNELYFFVDKNDEKQLNVYGDGVYRNKGDDVMTLKVKGISLEREKIKKASLKNEKLLLPSDPVIGEEEIEIGPDSAWTTTIKYAAMEEVTVPAGSFDNCLKITKTITWTGGDEQEDKEIVWFKRGVGMVKWKRSSGRVDELKSFNISK